jgi:hypothetical protein
MGPAHAQKPSPQLELFMNSRVGTTAVSAYPQFADGKLSSCQLDFNNIRRDDLYRQGGFMKIFGSFGLMEAKGNVAVRVKCSAYVSLKEKARN